MVTVRTDFKEAADFFKTHDNFLILSHASPDGDTLGCAFGLRLALQSMGKNAKNICADEISSRFDFMRDGVKEQDFEPETIVSVDVADKKLLGSFEEVYGDKVDFAIDHHATHVGFAKQLLIEEHAAACAQTVYKLIAEMGVELTKEMAACLYTGIATDSGCFKYQSVSPETHIIAAKLLEHDFGFDKINYLFFDMKTKSRIELEEKIYGGIEYYFDGKCAMVSLTKELLDSVDSEDVNGISAIPRQIEGVEVGIVIKQKETGWKASLRSNTEVSVQDICKALGGGGHERAAGCSFDNMSLEDVKKKLLEEIGRVI